MKAQLFLYRHRTLFPGLVVRVHAASIDGKYYRMSFYRNPRRINAHMLDQRVFRDVTQWEPIDEAHAFRRFREISC